MQLHAKPPENRRLYQQVADQIRDFIEHGGIAPGTRLPPEREFASQLGVSRPSLREALIALEIDGRVEIRMGSGVYVCQPPATAGRTTPALGDSPTELMQARAAVEGAVITLAAARATRQGLLRVRESLEAMRADHLRGHNPVHNDRRFHLSIAEMAGNSVLARLVGELFDGRHGPLPSRMSGRAENVRTWDQAMAEHEAIYRCLEARDPQSAAAAMCTHLRASQERWIGDVGGPDA